MATASGRNDGNRDACNARHLNAQHRRYGSAIPSGVHLKEAVAELARWQGDRGRLFRVLRPPPSSGLHWWYQNVTLLTTTLMKSCFYNERMATASTHFQKRLHALPLLQELTFREPYIPHNSSYNNMNTSSGYLHNIYISVLKCVSSLFLVLVSATKPTH